MKNTAAFLLLFFLSNHLIIGQGFTEILGRPESTSVTMSILFDENVDVYWEYGTVSGTYVFFTDTMTAEKDVPFVSDFSNLSPDTKYFYTTRYRISGSAGSWQQGPEHSFHTQRQPGAVFSFAVEADPHLDTNTMPAAYSLTLQNILSKEPDFLFDLGDNFMSEKLPVVTQAEIIDRHILYRPYYGSVCHSVPLYLVVGNHEGELGWRNDGTADCLPVWAANTRKQYYPNPFPDSFYSGDTVPENFVGLRENYYAWEWGNALFIVIDPYWYTVQKPDWGWTLGRDQYDWFKKVISTSKAKFRFVFCHQLVGGNGTTARGGSEFSGFFEMGGYNADSTWGFDAHRPGWEKPLHQLMAENIPCIYFHGHDHFFGKQEKDGIIYQEVPQPSAGNINNLNAEQYGYVNGVFLPNRGFVLVTVSDSSAKVDYIKTYLPNEEKDGHKNGEVAYSYTIKSSVSALAEKNEFPESFQMEQNYPNPFNSGTAIKYQLSAADKVRLSIYDVLGREIATPVSQDQQPGTYTITVHSESLSLTGGIYYFRLTVGNAAKTFKMVCIK